ncbi:MAG: small multi-drug export protein [Methanomassiliicoccales archaeon]|nr:small multi-drug export protein [Methanomassiliicoccales archaeon]NYT15994.1 small multi-drug export protein [Methanomassiliicoccales archaeon]
MEGPAQVEVKMISNWVEWLTVIILSMSPISELRGAIPVGVAMGLDPLAVFIVAVTFNALVYLPVTFGLRYTYAFFSTRWDWLRRFIEGIREKRRGVIEKYGLFGVVVFVAIPLPITGAWTGTLLVWLFDLDFKKGWLAVVAGVLISGTIMMGLTLAGIQIFG